MDTIVMNIHECDIEHEAPMDEEYGDEVLCAGWNPQLTQAAATPEAGLNRHVKLPADLAYVDIDTFLKRMYENQC
jgi:hypothetical protein